MHLYSDYLHQGRYYSNIGRLSESYIMTTQKMKKNQANSDNQLRSSQQVDDI